MKKHYINYLSSILFLLFAYTNITAQSVIIHEDLYSESGDGSLYRNTTYKFNTTNLNDLASIIIADDIDLFNVYYNDGSNQRYDLHGVSGKSLKAVFEGENDENQVIDINQLRSDFFSWFRFEDGQVTLVNFSVVAKHNFLPIERVEVTTGLTNDNASGTQYSSTAYYVKGIAAMADLSTITVAANVDWLSIYLKNDTGSQEPYIRADVLGVGNKTLETILIEEGYTIDDLYWDYKEWFEKNSSPTLVRLNMKAVQEQGNVKVTVYPDLFATGQHDQYAITAYKVNSTASLTHLKAYTILAAEVDFVNIIESGFLGFGTKTTTVFVTVDTDLEEIFIAEGIVISDLKDNYSQWFYKENSDAGYSPTLLNVNINAHKIIGSVPKVTKTENLFSSGTFEYQNTAYYVNSNAVPADLESYVLTGDAGLNIYYVDVNGDAATRDIIVSVAGRTLKEVLATEGIAITDLRLDYVSWFKDANDKWVLVNLNIKEKTILPDAEKIIVTNDLFWTSGAIDYEYTSYLTKSSATVDDLDMITLPGDVQFINVYTIETDVNGDPVRYTLHGVAGNTLKVALTAAGNDEGVDVDIATLSLRYLEWFLDIGDQLVLKNINIKSGKDVTLGVDDFHKNTLETSYYPNPVNDVLNISILDKEGFAYSVYSIKGNEVLNGLSKDASVSINTSTLSQGVYVLKIQSGDSQFSTKFIVK